MRRDGWSVALAMLTAALLAAIPVYLVMRWPPVVALSAAGTVVCLVAIVLLSVDLIGPGAE